MNLLTNSFLRLLLVVILFLTATDISKSQQSNQWMLGFIGKMDFNSGNPQYSLYGDSIFLTYTNAGISDSNGQIQFWTNGAAVFQNDRDTMQNGTLFHLPYSQAYTPIGMNIYQGAIILPIPDSQNQYYLFHASVGNYTSSPTDYKKRAQIYYSTIDMDANGGLGTVVNNSQFLEDSVHMGNMTAVRHANGRDWWLVAHEVASSYWYVWLVSPQGITLVNKQPVGSTSAGAPAAPRTIGQLCFTPNGDYLAYMLGFGGGSVRIEILDFDRCTGMFGSVVKTHQPQFSNNPSHLGMQFSPSGRYLYATLTTTLHQYDMQAPNFGASRVLIDTYNGTQAPFSATFSQMKLAPDGKIYCHASNGNWSLHVINEPDSAGLACYFVQNQFSTGIFYTAFISLPNMPNYELGALIGSPCDSLTGINDYLLEKVNEIKIFPNPFENEIHIQSDIFIPDLTFQLYDLTGREVLYKLVGSNEELTIERDYLTSGLYIYKFMQDGVVIKKGKLIAK